MREGASFDRLFCLEKPFQTLTRELVKNLDTCLWAEVFKWAAFYEHRLHMGSKEILHLEAFVAKFMSIYKTYIIEE